jgi:N-methylhydantoinase A
VTPSTNPRFRLGVDVGGTFTDVMVVDGSSGELRRTKVLSDPLRGGTVIREALERLQITMDDLSLLIHATTIVTNLIIERRGARVGLLTTSGFRDILEIGLSFRPDPYDLQWEKSPPLVERALRRDVLERIAPDGTVLEPLNTSRLLEDVEALVAAGVEAIAIVFLHSYANPAHEVQAREIIKETYPDLDVSVSSEIDPQAREYERTTTTVLNTYARPAMRAYTERLSAELSTPSQGMFYMHSGGGVIPPARAAARPVELVSSGPSAGAIAAAQLGAHLDIPNIITFDIGGTSCDVCLIEDRQLQERDEIEIEWGVPLRVRAIDVTSVGAGGGSIAWHDDGGAMRVGPRSAGGNPGPACYGLGGEAPTITDANLILGILDPDRFLGGRIHLDRQASEAAFATLAHQFESSVGDVARGARRIAVANMAQAVRTITVQKGIDPRGFALVAFGGAGGQFALDVADEMEIDRVIFPPFGSTFSAFGLLTADLKASERMAFMHVLPEGTDAAEPVFRELSQRAAEGLEQSGDPSAIEVQRYCHLRYLGQSHELTIAFPESGWAGVPSEFERAHERMFGTRLGDPIETVALGVTVTRKLSPTTIPAAHAADGAFDLGTTQVLGVKGPVRVLARPNLGPGLAVPGPAVLYEEDSTIYVPEGWIGVAGDIGELSCVRA